MDLFLYDGTQLIYEWFWELFYHGGYAMNWAADLISKSITYYVPLGPLGLCCFTCTVEIILVSTSCVAAKIKRDNINIQPIAPSLHIAICQIW